MYGVYTKINSQGLRDYEYSIKKPEKIFRIIGLGDSYTYGWGVKLEDIYLKQLEKKLRNVEVINFGVGGYNTVQEVEFFKEKIDYEPDLVIIGYLLNDASDNWMPDLNKDGGGIKYAEKSKGSIPIPLGLKIFLSENLDSYKFLSQKYHNLLMNLGIRESTEESSFELYKDDNINWVKAQNAMKELSDLSKKYNFKVLFVMLPYLYELDNYPYLSLNKKVLDIADENGFYTLDTTSYFKGYKDNSLWVDPTDKHPNSKGHEIIANAIYEKLINESLIPIPKEEIEVKYGFSS